MRYMICIIKKICYTLCKLKEKIVQQETFPGKLVRQADENQNYH